MGPETLAFETELAKAVGAEHVVTVNSCTSALFLSLLMHGVGVGDEVICPSLTWCSTANAALYLGAIPVFCDVDPDTLCLTPQTVRAALTPRTKAVMVVHFGGLAMEIAALRAVLPKSVAIIEDAAHAFGSCFANGKPVGSSGNATCFSFYANKNLSTGEGGAIALFDGAQADRIRSLRQHGLPNDAWRRFIDPRQIGSGQLTQLGYKMNYTDLQASLGRVQLRRQVEFAQRRLAVAKHYLSRLAATAPGCTVQRDLINPAHARHLFVLCTPPAMGGKQRNALLVRLRTLNIGAGIHYSLLHHMPLYASCPSCSLPVTEALGPRLLTLPISASMTETDAEDVMQALGIAWAESFSSPYVATKV